MKKRGFGVGKYNGVGGKVEQGETVLEATVRETNEEIGVLIDARNAKPCAHLAFKFEGKPQWDQVCHVYLSHNWDGDPHETDEMKPEWFNVNQLPFERMWIDDPYWLPLIFAGRRVNAEFVFNSEGNEILSKKIEIEG